MTHREAEVVSIGVPNARGREHVMVDRVEARYVGQPVDLWKRRLEPGTVHTIYVTSANPREIYLSIDEESYPVTLEDLISDWEAI